MTSPSRPALVETAPDPLPDDVLAWAERRRAMLDRMAELGIALTEELVRRYVDSSYYPEPKHEPAKAFAHVARAVRFTLALQARVEVQILAIRNGDAIKAAAASGTEDSATPDLPDATQRALRQRARDAVANVIDRESPDPHTAERTLERLHETLIEGEDYDAFLALPFRDCIAAICADLGLVFDWSAWSDAPDPPSLGVGRADVRLEAGPGWGDGAVSVIDDVQDPQHSAQPAYPPPGSRPDAAGPPSRLRGREAAAP